MTKENRRFTRVAFEVPAILSVGGHEFPLETIYNLSVGGVLVPGDKLFQPGKECTLTIPLSGSNQELMVQVSGEFVWCTDDTAAVKFTHIDVDSLGHLQNIIRYNAQDPDQVESEILKHPGLI